MLTIEVVRQYSQSLSFRQIWQGVCEKSVAEYKFLNAEVLTENTLSIAIDFSNIIRFQITRNLRKQELKLPTTGSAPAPLPPLPKTNVIV